MTEPQKTCSRCKISKAIDEFNFRYKAKNVRQSYCKECGKILTRSHYKRNKRQYLDKNLRSVRIRREFAQQIKSRPCADCGVQYPYYVMDFDHKEGEKKEHIISAIDRMSINALKREIAKCDVVCANCHRERTYQRRLKQKYKK